MTAGSQPPPSAQLCTLLEGGASVYILTYIEATTTIPHDRNHIWEKYLSCTFCFFVSSADMEGEGLTSCTSASLQDVIQMLWLYFLLAMFIHSP